MSIVPNRPQTPHLKLFLPESEDSSFGGELSPAMSLTQFFEQWFLPHQLRAEQTHAGTITIYRNALRYWSALTGDPPVGNIDREMISNFKEKLAAVKYRRGPMSPERSITRSTQAKHLRSLRAILYRVGPATDPKRMDTTSILVTVHGLKCRLFAVGAER